MLSSRIKMETPRGGQLGYVLVECSFAIRQLTADQHVGQ